MSASLSVGARVLHKPSGRAATLACDNDDGTFDLIYDDGAEQDDVPWSDLSYEGELKREVTAPIIGRTRQQKLAGTGSDADKLTSSSCACMLSAWLGWQMRGKPGGLDQLGEMLLRPERASLKLLRQWLGHLSLGGAAGGFCIGSLIQTRAAAADAEVLQLALPLASIPVGVGLVCAFLRKPMFKRLRTDTCLVAFVTSFVLLKLLVLLVQVKNARSSMGVWLFLVLNATGLAASHYLT